LNAVEQRRTEGDVIPFDSGETKGKQQSLENLPSSPSLPSCYKNIPSSHRMIIIIIIILLVIRKKSRSNNTKTPCFLLAKKEKQQKFPTPISLYTDTRTHPYFLFVFLLFFLVLFMLQPAAGSSSLFWFGY